MMMRNALIGLFVLGVALSAQSQAPATPAKAAPTPQQLEDAIGTGDAAAVRKLLDAGADPNGAGNGAPTTPLLFTALKLGADDKGTTIVKLLLSREADPNLPGDLRPLYAAILRGNADEAQALLSDGADADLAGCLRPTLPGTKERETARQLAQKKGAPFTAIVATTKQVSHRRVPKTGELKRPTMCSDH